MRVDTYVAVLGDGKRDLELSPEMREWELRKGAPPSVCLNSRVQDRILTGIGRVRTLARRKESVSGLLFTSGVANGRLGCTVASAMEQYAGRLFPELEKAVFIRPPVIVNHDIGVSGLIAEMRWAYGEARRMSECPRIEFIASPYQVPFVHLANLGLVWVRNYWVIPTGSPMASW